MLLVSRWMVSITIATCSMLASVTAAAQAYPTKPITIVVPNGPGGASDLVPRILAPEMAKILGQQVLVDNKPGANNMIGYEYVAKQAPADGYTMLQVTDTGFSILPLISKEMRFDPLQDLPPVIGVAQSRLVLVSSPEEPWKSFNELIAYAKARPGKLNYASSSSSTRLQTEAMLRASGISVVYVPYKTTGAGMTSLLSREAQMGFMNEGQATPMGDRLRVLAVTGDKRSPAYPQVPTFAELGMPQIMGFTIGLNVRAGTPKAAVDKLYAAASQALKHPEVRAQFAKLELEPIDQPGPASAKNLAQQTKLFAETAKQIGFRPD